MRRAVIFDLDGTLVDSLEDIADSMNATLAELGFPTHELDPYRIFVGDGVGMLAFRALPEARRDPGTLSRCVEIMRRRYTQQMHDKTRPYPGIIELLDELGDRNVPLVVLSNKVHELTVDIVRRQFGENRFERVLGPKPGIPQKPDPTAALQIAAELDLAPEHWLFVGDTSTDMQTASAAGMMGVGVLWGFRSADELLAHGASAVIAHPSELIDRAFLR